jgi:hypothetical protein
MVYRHFGTSNHMDFPMREIEKEFFFRLHDRIEISDYYKQWGGRSAEVPEALRKHSVSADLATGTSPKRSAGEVPAKCRSAGKAGNVSHITPGSPGGSV